MSADNLQLSFRLQATITRLWQSSFLRNVMVVMSGTAIAQSIGFSLSPVISRFFSPSDFGVFGSFYSVAGIITAGSTLQYSQTIMLPKEREDAFHLFIVSCACTLGVGLACLLACAIAGGTINSLMKTGGAWPLALLVVATVVGGLNESCQAWCVRGKAFKHTSASQMVRSASSNTMQIGFGCLKAGAAGLIISNVLADVAASLSLVTVLLPDLQALRRAVRWERMKRLAVEYRDFPIYSASQNVINAVSTGLPVLLLTHYYGIATAGAYAFGLRILNLPMGLLLRALQQVLFQKAAETQHHGRPLTPLFLKTTAGLCALAILPSSVLLAWAPQLFVWIFGAPWHTAGEFARWLMLWMLFAFCNLPAVLFARLIRIQQAIFFCDLITLVARAATLVLGGYYLNAMQSVILFSIVGAIMNVALILVVGRTLLCREREGQAAEFVGEPVARLSHTRPGGP